MIIKKLLKDWNRQINKDLEGVPAQQISEATGLNRQTVKNYMTLTKQAKFDPEVIKKINAYRDSYKALAESL